MAAALPLALGGLAGLAAKKLLSPKKQEAPAPAAPAGPTIMPLADDERVKEARRRSIIQQRARSGRDSTILTGDKLGG